MKKHIKHRFLDNKEKNRSFLLKKSLVKSNHPILKYKQLKFYYKPITFLILLTLFQFSLK